jgi:hypothetical protein
MHIHKKLCRCCGKYAFERLSPEAEVDQFFLHYGLQITVTFKTGARRAFLDKLERKWPKSLPALAPSIRRLLKLQAQRKGTARMPYGLCASCSFLAPWPEISNDHLFDYYSYYLSPQYKESRIQSDPSYAAIAPLHGCQQEFLVRRNLHTNYMTTVLDQHVSQKEVSEMRLLDYGGGEGGIQPVLNFAEIHTYDVGECRPSLGIYDVVQCMHVLEHVGNPLATIREAFDCCMIGGLLYVEVPYEFTTVEDCVNGRLPCIDEHINKFSIESVRAMLESLGGNILSVEEGSIEILHLNGSARVVRGLVRRI